jgi:hypothetical protein
MPGEYQDVAEDRGLIDLTGLTAGDLHKFGDSALARELRQVYKGDTGQAVIAGFDNDC